MLMVLTFIYTSTGLSNNKACSPLLTQETLKGHRIWHMHGKQETTINHKQHHRLVAQQGYGNPL
jgi:hypothetical protein